MKFIILLCLLATISLIIAFPSTGHNHKKLVLVGGGKLPQAAKTQFIKFAGGREARLLIIPSANKHAESLDHMRAWGGEDITSVQILHAKSRQEASNAPFYRKIRLATGVWISGGDQSRLVDLYANTPVVDELKSLLGRGGVVGGTSAGASIVGEVMPFEAGEMKGFCLLDKFIIDQHFSNRSREERLRKIVDVHPGMLGVGIDEGTAVIIDDDEITVVGDGNVNIFKS